MPFRPPALDDRNYQDLVDEILARVPAHTPEWTNPRPGDPGRTLVELFCFVADTVLYRANAIPERQRLAFLKLLGIQMRAARPARCLVTVSREGTTSTKIRTAAKLKGPVEFEANSELTILPVSAQAFYKRHDLSAEESDLFDELKGGLQAIYGVDDPVAYVTTPIFEDDTPDISGFDVVQDSVDQCLWIAVFAKQPEDIPLVRRAIGDTGEELINVGIVPAMEVTDPLEDVNHLAPIRHIWEISSPDIDGQPNYQTLDVISDTTHGLTHTGVLRLRLPTADAIGSSSNDVRQQLNAGVGDRPPRIDDPETAAELVAWLRLRPDPDQPFPLDSLRLTWIGINAVEAEQLSTIRGRVIGQSDNSPDQEFSLHDESVESGTLQIDVEDERGFRRWTMIDDLALASPDAPVYQLDSEAGTIRFGDGMRGRVPELGSRIRVAHMRVGGGGKGNLPPQSMTGITAVDLDGNPVTGLKVQQSLAATGGEDVESIEDAERRVPSVVRHRYRAVTGDDYKQIAAETPGVQLGRVEVLPRFKPRQRRSGVAGVVSTMIWPHKAMAKAPNPRADRSLLESVYNYVDARRPIGTELYVIGCEYISIGVSVSVSIDDQFPRDQTIFDVRDSISQYLWSLPSGGPSGNGWPLGKAVSDRELEVVASRVAGVKTVNGINLFRERDHRMELIEPVNQCGESLIAIELWQLPELSAIQVVAGGPPPSEIRSLRNPNANDSATPVPVVPEVC